MPLPRGYTENLRIADPEAPVEAAWRFFADRDGEHRVLPDGRCDLILRFRSDGESVLGDVLPVIAEPSTRFHLVPIEAGTAFVGVRLRPGTARAVLDANLMTLTNQVFIGAAALEVMPSLAKLCRAATSIEDVADRLDRHVAALYRAGKVDRFALGVIDTLHVTGGRMSIEAIARLHAAHPKTVRRRILSATGLSPKQFASIVRFHRALRLRRDAGLDAAATAFEAGYADQPHMTRSFRQMGGISAALPSEVVLAGLPI